MTTIIRDIINPALALLPPQMTSDESRAMLVAIGLQESALKYRTQHAGGPARGLWQFERIGVQGVLRHPATRGFAADLCWRCGVAATTAAVYHRIETDDILAAGIARLALWPFPYPLPKRGDSADGWFQYLNVWRPGKPHKDKWEDNFHRAWEIVSEG